MEQIMSIEQNEVNLHVKETKKKVMDDLLAENEHPLFSVDISKYENLTKGYEYTVEILERPANFVFEKNIIVTVGRFGHAEAQGLLPHSKALFINDKEATRENFKELYRSTALPFKMRLFKFSNAPEDNMESMDTRTSLTVKEKVGLFLVYFSVAIDFIANMMVGPVLPFFTKSLGIPDYQLGILMGSYSLASIPGGLITLKVAKWGGTKAADTLHPKGIMYSVLGSGVTLILQGLAWDFTSLLAFRICAGLTGSSIPVALTHLGMTVPNNLKPQWMSYIGVVIAGSLVIGPTFGGSLVNYGIQVPYFAGAGFAFSGLVLIAVFLSNLRIPKSKGAATDRLSCAQYGCLFLALIKSVSFVGFISMGGLYQINQFGVSGQDLGLIFGAHGILTVFNNILVVPKVVKKMGFAQAYFLAFTMMLVGFVASSFMNEWYTFMACISLLVGFGYSYAINSTNLLLDRYSTPSTRAKLNTYASMLDSLGFFAGSVVWGSVFEFGDVSLNFPAFIWLCTAGFAIVNLLSITIISRTCLKKADKLKAKAAAQKKEGHPEEEDDLLDWQDVEGTDEDYIKLGKTIGQVLSKKGFQWTRMISRIGTTCDDLFPELHAKSIQEGYHKVMMLRQLRMIAHDIYAHDRSDDENEVFKTLGDLRNCQHN